MAGLGDFGFTVAPSKAAIADEDERVEVREDDFENIVDDLSDGEGDETRGQQARLERERQEDKDGLAAVRLGLT